MNNIVISCVYPPEPMVSAKTSSQVFDELVHRPGKTILLASFPNRPGGRVYPGFSRRLYVKEKTNGNHHIIRCWNTFSHESSVFSRLLENISFGLTSSLQLLLLPCPDVIYVNTWPVFAQGLTCLAARLRRIPLVLSIQDIYPESLAAQGRFSAHNPFYRILRRLDRVNARSASALIAISEKFARIYTQDRGIPPQKVHVIPNWVDPAEIQLLPKDQFRRKVDIPADAFVFGYAGNIGVAAGVEAVIEAFARLDVSNTYLLIAGDGSRRQACQDLVEQLGVKNVILHSPWPAEETSEVLAAADVLVLPTHGKQSLASVPSKMLNYMLAARSILAIVSPQSDTAQVIHEAGCGWQVDPEDPEMIKRSFALALATDQAQLDSFGKAGREYIIKHFSKDVCLPRVLDVLEQVARNE